MCPHSVCQCSFTGLRYKTVVYQFISWRLELRLDQAHIFSSQPRLQRDSRSIQFWLEIFKETFGLEQIRTLQVKYRLHSLCLRLFPRLAPNVEAVTAN